MREFHRIEPQPTQSEALLRVPSAGALESDPPVLSGNSRRAVLGALQKFSPSACQLPQDAATGAARLRELFERSPVVSVELALTGLLQGWPQKGETKFPLWRAVLLKGLPIEDPAVEEEVERFADGVEQRIYQRYEQWQLEPVAEALQQLRRSVGRWLEGLPVTAGNESIRRAFDALDKLTEKPLRQFSDQPLIDFGKVLKQAGCLKGEVAEALSLAQQRCWRTVLCYMPDWIERETQPTFPPNRDAIIERTRNALISLAHGTRMHTLRQFQEDLRRTVEALGKRARWREQELYRFLLSAIEALEAPLQGTKVEEH